MGAGEYVLKMREKIGTMWMLMPGASALIINDRQEILLQRRADNGNWSLIGGGADPGEHPAETVMREAYEEAGVTIIPERIVGVYGGRETMVTYPNGDQSAYTITAFLCRHVSGDPRVNDEESLEVRFFPVDALPDSLPQKHRKRIPFALSSTAPYFEIPTAPLVSTAETAYMSQIRALIDHELLMAPGSTAVILNEKGEVLVQQRVDDGLWNLPGGMQEIGEPPAGTVIREVLEETGLHVFPERLIGVYGGTEYIWHYGNGDRVAYTNYAFLCRVTGGELKIEDGESIAQRFVPVDQLPEPFIDRHATLIDHALTRQDTYFHLP